MFEVLFILLTLKIKINFYDLQSIKNTLNCRFVEAKVNQSDICIHIFQNTFYLYLFYKQNEDKKGSLYIFGLENN